MELVYAFCLTLHIKQVGSKAGKFVYILEYLYITGDNWCVVTLYALFFAFI